MNFLGGVAAVVVGLIVYHHLTRRTRPKLTVMDGGLTGTRVPGQPYPVNSPLRSAFQGGESVGIGVIGWPGGYE